MTIPRGAKRIDHKSICGKSLKRGCRGRRKAMRVQWAVRDRCDVQGGNEVEGMGKLTNQGKERLGEEKALSKPLSIRI